MKVISDKDMCISSTWGSGTRLYANVPKNVGEDIGLLALQKGAQRYNPDNVAHQEPEDAVFEEVVGETTEEFDPALVECLARLIEQGNPEDFKVDGTPKATVVNKATGRTVRSDERDAAWEVALNA